MLNNYNYIVNCLGVSVDTVRSDESEVNVFYAGAKSRPTGLIGEASFETGVMNMEKHSNGEKFNAKALSVGAQGMSLFPNGYYPLKQPDLRVTICEHRWHHFE